MARAAVAGGCYLHARKAVVLRYPPAIDGGIAHLRARFGDDNCLARAARTFAQLHQARALARATVDAFESHLPNTAQSDPESKCGNAVPPHWGERRASRAPRGGETARWSALISKRRTGCRKTVFLIWKTWQNSCRSAIRIAPVRRAQSDTRPSWCESVVCLGISVVARAFGVCLVQ